MQALSGKIEQDILQASSKFTLWLLYVTLLVLHSAQTLSNLSSNYNMQNYKCCRYWTSK